MNRISKTKIGRFEIGKLLIIALALSLLSLMGVSALLIGGETGGFFNGTMDEVMIFSTGLNMAEVGDIYNQTAPRFKLRGLQTFLNQTKLNISQGYDTVRVTADYYSLLDMYDMIRCIKL